MDTPVEFKIKTILNTYTPMHGDYRALFEKFLLEPQLVTEDEVTILAEARLGNNHFPAAAPLDLLTLLQNDGLFEHSKVLDKATHSLPSADKEKMTFHRIVLCNYFKEPRRLKWKDKLGSETWQRLEKMGTSSLLNPLEDEWQWTLPPVSIEDSHYASLKEAVFRQLKDLAYEGSITDFELGDAISFQRYQKAQERIGKPEVVHEGEDRIHSGSGNRIYIRPIWILPAEPLELNYARLAVLRAKIRTWWKETSHGLEKPNPQLWPPKGKTNDNIDRNYVRIFNDADSVKKLFGGETWVTDFSLSDFKTCKVLDLVWHHRAMFKEHPPLMDFFRAYPFPWGVSRKEWSTILDYAKKDAQYSRFVLESSFLSSKFKSISDTDFQEILHPVSGEDIEHIQYLLAHPVMGPKFNILDLLNLFQIYPQLKEEAPIKARLAFCKNVRFIPRILHDPSRWRDFMRICARQKNLTISAIELNLIPYLKYHECQQDASEDSVNFAIDELLLTVFAWSKVNYSLLTNRYAMNFSGRFLFTAWERNMNLQAEIKANDILYKKYTIYKFLTAYDVFNNRSRIEEALASILSDKQLPENIFQDYIASNYAHARLFDAWCKFPALRKRIKQNDLLNTLLETFKPLEDFRGENLVELVRYAQVNMRELSLLMKESTNLALAVFDHRELLEEFFELAGDVHHILSSEDILKDKVLEKISTSLENLLDAGMTDTVKKVILCWRNQCPPQIGKIFTEALTEKIVNYPDIFTINIPTFLMKMFLAKHFDALMKIDYAFAQYTSDELCSILADFPQLLVLFLNNETLHQTLVARHRNPAQAFYNLAIGFLSQKSKETRCASLVFPLLLRAASHGHEKAMKEILDFEQYIRVFHQKKLEETVLQGKARCEYSAMCLEVHEPIIDNIITLLITKNPFHNPLKALALYSLYRNFWELKALKGKLRDCFSPMETIRLDPENPDLTFIKKQAQENQEVCHDILEILKDAKTFTLTASLLNCVDVLHAEQKDVLFAKAIEYLSVEALRAYIEKHYPSPSPQLSTLGERFFQSGEYPKALVCLEIAETGQLATMLTLHNRQENRAADFAFLPSDNSTSNKLLGLACLDGKGLEKNPVLAAKYLETAAKQGDPEAQFVIAHCYREGLGVDAEPKMAVHYLAMAANQGFNAANKSLGLAYLDGDDVDQDAVIAMQYLEKAAEQGDPQAQFLAGRCYAKGKGVNPDPKKAIHYWERSAAQGFSPAEIQMARYYTQGLVRDYPKAIAIFNENKAQLSKKDLTIYGLAILFAYVSDISRPMRQEEIVMLRMGMKTITKTLITMFAEGEPDQDLLRLIKVGCDKNMPIYGKGPSSASFFSAGEDRKTLKIFLKLSNQCGSKQQSLNK